MSRLASRVVLALSVVLGVSLITPIAQADPGVVVTYESIPGDGGDLIKGIVAMPTGQGPGPFPLLVMPSSWGMPHLEYAGVAAKLARERGYVVVSYSSRSFYDSAGENDILGPKTINDVSRIIDWMVATKSADAGRVGATGISYGAITSLLGAAQDARIDAVVAMSTYADLLDSLYYNNTLSEQGTAMLLGSGYVTSKTGPFYNQVATDIATDNIEGVKQIAPVRSPANRLASYRANGTAIMIANNYDDGLFPPNQIVDFYTKLDVPKKLMFSPGDHATAEAPGAIGLENEQWDQAIRWFDHHVKGVANGIDSEKPVNLKDKRTGVWRDYSNWTQVGTQRKLYLDGPNWFTGFGGFVDTPRTGWSKSIAAGVPTQADSGTLMVTGALQGWFGLSPVASTTLTNAAAAGKWSTSQYPAGVLVSGSPVLHTTVTPSTANTSLFAYLYDTDALGNGTLITHAPYTLLGATPGQPHTVDIKLQSTSWSVAPGHRLVLIVDTVDPRYRGKSTVFNDVVFSSPNTSPSSLTIPIG